MMSVLTERRGTAMYSIFPCPCRHAIDGQQRHFQNVHNIEVYWSVCYQSWQETIILQPPCTNNVFGGNQGKFRIDLQDYHQDKHFDYTAPGLSADAMFCLITDTLHWWWCGLEHDSGVLALQSLNMSLAYLIIVTGTTGGARVKIFCQV